jgi:multidrug efflux system membrane fusion protein
MQIIIAIFHYLRAQATPLRFVIAVVATAVIWVGMGALHPRMKPEQRAEPTLATVQIMPSQALLTDRILNLYGTLAAFSKIELRAQAEGKIERLPAKEGTLLHKGAVIATLDARDSVRKLERAESNLKSSEIAYNAALSLHKKKLASASQLSAAKSALDGARAELIEAQHNLEIRTIYAPAAGVLDKYLVEVGDVVDPMSNQATIANFIVSGALSAVAYVPEANIQWVKAGQAARIQTIEGEQYTAIVRVVGTVADSDTRSFRVELTLQETPPYLRAGMTASVLLNTGQIKAHRVPAAILCLDDQGHLGVKAVIEDYVVFYPVTFLQQTPEGVDITGLPEQANLIVQGFAAVLPGQHVLIERVANPLLKPIEQP